MQAECRGEPRGDVAAASGDRRLLQADDVGREHTELARDHGQALLEMLAVAAPAGRWAAVQEVEGDDAERGRRLVPGGGAAGESGQQQDDGYESGYRNGAHPIPWMGVGL